MIRIAAAGDLHFGRDSAGTLRPHLERLANQADVLLMCGDLGRFNTPIIKDPTTIEYAEYLVVGRRSTSFRTPHSALRIRRIPLPTLPASSRRGRRRDA